ncbi:MAG: hypothetical protein BWY54_00199 [Candidatus Dependentiae bacterium ADurb.Bin331]|nr:MAG: hypothetical protein BWY54_00199 [Candidatus Dependentiae bacterium ADurb.Bin331]
MKQVKSLLLSVCIGSSLITHESLASHKKHESRFFEKALYGTVMVGAVISALFWLPGTLDTINKYGVEAAIKSTQIPRVALDGLTVAACAVAWNEANKSESKRDHKKGY